MFSRAVLWLTLEIQKTESHSVARFLREQLDTISQQLAQSENVLKNFREGAQVVNLPAEGQAQVTRLVDLQGQRSALDAERIALSQLLSEIQATAAKSDPNDP